MKKTIEDELEKFNKGTIISIMYDALDLMQQYNGRSAFYCIATAMGYDVDENGKVTKSK